MNEEAQYKYEGQKVHSSEGTYSITNWPNPVGFWILYPEGPTNMRFSMYKKPNRIQIWFTEKLLGWKWEDWKEWEGPK